MKTRDTMLRALKVTAVGLALVLVAASCSGSSEPVEQSAAAQSDAATADTSTAATTDTTDDAGDKLIARLGSQDVAVDATLASLERGYSGKQVLDGIAAATIEASGMISNVSPAGPALGLIDLGSLKSASASRQGKPVKRALRQQDLLPIEQLRESAGNGALHNELGNRVLLWIALLLQNGESPQTIIERLIFGDFDPRESKPAATAAPAPEEPAESAAPADEPEPEAVESDDRLEFSGPFAASIGLVPEPGDTVLIDLFWASTDGPESLLKGRGDVLGQTGEAAFSDTSDSSCLYATIDFELASVGAYEWAGVVTFQVYAEDGACPEQGFPTPTDSAQGEATARLEGSMLILDFSVNEDSYTVTAPVRDDLDS